MSKRNIEKHILMNKAEAQDLLNKAKRACLSEDGHIRLLLKGYEPRERPDDRFFQAIYSLNEMIHTAQKLLERSYQLGVVDKDTVEREIKSWVYYISNIESEFIRPEKSPIKWK